MDKSFYVYIITNQPFGTLYTGVTNNLARRMFEHREGLVDGFTKTYGLCMLVYYEVYPTAYEAICREKCIKRWKRDWKMRLIKEFNPEWKDLCETLHQ